jgi:NADH-quinone oxidoreductase subunit N
VNLSAAQISALLPLLFPALTACVLPIAALDKDQSTLKWVRGLTFAITGGMLAVSFLYLTRLWVSGAQPVCGPLRMDRLAQFGGILVVVTALLALLQLWDHLHQEGWVKGETLCLLMFSVTGMILFTATTHLMILFLALELFSLPLYALTATLRLRPEASEGGLKYFLTGAVASSAFLMGIVLLYGATGTLDVAAMRLTADPLAFAGLALLGLGFFFKVSAIPFHQWTPDVYEAAPHPLAGFMSVATKGVAFLALVRVFTVLGPLALPRLQSAAAILAVLTLVGGNLMALVQVRIKRMLAYSSISHAGYLLLAVTAGTPRAHGAILYYLAGYMAMNMGAFALLTSFGLLGDGATFDALRGRGWQRPALAIAVTMCMLGLAGIPPTAGFFGKYMIFVELIRQGHVGLAVVGVIASLVSVAYYMRIPMVLFMESIPEGSGREESALPQVHAPFAGATLLVCGALVLVLGLCQGQVMASMAAPAIEDTFTPAS